MDERRNDDSLGSKKKYLSIEVKLLLRNYFILSFHFLSFARNPNSRFKYIQGVAK